MKTPTAAPSRGQVSFELLLLLAALLAMLAFVLPFAQKNMVAARELALVEKQKAALQQIVFLAREAHALGKGTELQQRIEVAADTEIRYGNGWLTLTFAGATEHELREPLEFGVALSAGEKNSLKRGAWLVRVKNEGRVRLSFAET